MSRLTEEMVSVLGAVGYAQMILRDGDRDMHSIVQEIVRIKGNDTDEGGSSIGAMWEMLTDARAKLGALHKIMSERLNREQEKEKLKK